MKNMKMKNWCCCDCTSAHGDYVYTALRAFLGVIFFYHGWMKVTTMGMPAVAGMLSGMGFPMADVFAYILSYGELVAGALLIIGLYTHWAAKFAVIVGVVAWVVVHLSNGFDARNGGWEFIALITITALYVLAHGAGKISLDETHMKHTHKHD